MKISTLLVGFLVMFQINAEAAKITATERDAMTRAAKEVAGPRADEMLSLDAISKSPQLVRTIMAGRSREITALATRIKVDSSRVVEVASNVPHIITLMALLDSGQASIALKQAAPDFFQSLGSGAFRLSDSKEALKTLNSILEKAPGMQDQVAKILAELTQATRGGTSLAEAFTSLMKRNAQARNMTLEKYLEEVFKCKMG